jgi:predicted HTH domain antitoxin
MSVLASRHEIHKMLDNLPPEALPDLLDYLDYLRYRAGRQALSARAEEAIRLYADGEISLGRAAELAGMNYFRFEQILRKRGVKLAEPRTSQVADSALQQVLIDGLLG